MTTPSLCAAWSDISYSASADSPETIRQIIAANAAHDSACPAPKADKCAAGVRC